MAEHVDSQDTAAVEREARRLYDECQTVKPSWEQLGDTTKSVWRAYAQGQPRVAFPSTRSNESAPQPSSLDHVSLEVGRDQPSLF